MRFASFLMAAAFLAASGTVMAQSMSSASPKPSPAMHSMKSSSMKNSTMKGGHMKSKSGHMMASPKPTSRP